MAGVILRVLVLYRITMGGNMKAVHTLISTRNVHYIPGHSGSRYSNDVRGLLPIRPGVLAASIVRGRDGRIVLGEERRLSANNAFPKSSQ